MGNRLPPHLFLSPPVTHFFLYRGSNRPTKGFEGDWPVRGAVYACHIVLDPSNGFRWIRPQGFVLPRGCPGFRPTCFKAIAEVWLN